MSLISHIARAIIATAVASTATASAHEGGPGFVYVMTNGRSGNSVIQYRRDGAGHLTAQGEASTGGLGSGGTLDPLGSQHSLVLTARGDRLVAVDAGSNEVSVLSAGPGGLALLGEAPSGGEFPNSVAVSGDLVYVLNAHGTPNVTGFRMSGSGMLQAIPGAQRDLPGGGSAAPADVRFSPDGAQLVVTETGTGQIDVFDVDETGLPGAPRTFAAAGRVPFGVTFRSRGDDVLLVSEAGSASLSSYRLDDDGALDLVSGAVPDGGAATCWVSVAPFGRYAFVSNTGSRTISSYAVGEDGELTLAQATATATGEGSAPIDSALTRDARFLYVVDSTLGRVLGYRTAGAGLTPAAEVDGLPTSIQGIDAR